MPANELSHLYILWGYVRGRTASFVLLRKMLALLSVVIGAAFTFCSAVKRHWVEMLRVSLASGACEWKKCSKSRRSSCGEERLKGVVAHMRRLRTRRSGLIDENAIRHDTFEALPPMARREAGHLAKLCLVEQPPAPKPTAVQSIAVPQFIKMHEVCVEHPLCGDVYYGTHCAVERFGRM